MVTYWKLYTRMRHHFAKEGVIFSRISGDEYILYKNDEVIDQFKNIYEQAKSLGLIKEWEVYLAPNGVTYIYGTLDGDVKIS